jgi:hypothetical protein
MTKIPEFLIKPGIKFSKEDLDNAIKNHYRMSSSANDYKSYFLYSPFEAGPDSLFCIERNDKRTFRFLWDIESNYYDEETFLAIGENPDLLILK